MIPEHNNPFNPTDRMLRQFALLWVVFFGAVAVLQEVRHDRTTLAIVLGVLAVTVGPIGVAWPRAIRPIFIGAMTVTYPIGWVVSRVILAVLFYGLFTPFALTFRAIRRDALGLRAQPRAETYWRTKVTAKDKSDYFHQF